MAERNMRRAVYSRQGFGGSNRHLTGAAMRTGTGQASRRRVGGWRRHFGPRVDLATPVPALDSDPHYRDDLLEADEVVGIAGIER
jgi:hypothetical protein